MVDPFAGQSVIAKVIWQSDILGQQGNNQMCIRDRLEGLSYEEISFEGYGPGGVAVIVDVLTDNRNRAVSEIRHAFSKNGGNLGETGSVRFMFHKKGLIARCV